MTDEFRTPTGQTGRDAYIYEAAQIANAQRELNARFRNLVGTVRRENPTMFQHVSDFAFSGAEAASGFTEYLRGQEHYLAWLESEGGSS